ncbi:7 transmembrane receptor (Secretin family) domain-containing protein [Phthorimaea operculella]|nr:7 transmembrane receptor (Secretin family) domain-containing protein [Phthorimaea operculella]
MLNSNQSLDFAGNPKLLAFDSLIRECFSQNGNHSRVLDEKGSYNNEEPRAYCPRTFDGFACWDETPASAIAVQPCPHFVIGFDPRRSAFKTCTENGTWFTHPQWNKPWTNYTTCVDVEDLDFRNLIQNLYVGGYSLSLGALVLSLFIFFYFRSLQCTRIRIHMHLFASFALNNIMWILWYYLVVNRPDVLQANKDWCQALHVAMHYFMVTSYLWMFCEGLHLHIALVVVFVKDQVALRWFVAIGWGLPLLIVAVYAAVRYHLPEATLRLPGLLLVHLVVYIRYSRPSMSICQQKPSIKLNHFCIGVISLSPKVYLGSCWCAWWSTSGTLNLGCLFASRSVLSS